MLIHRALLHQRETGQWLSFSDPVEVITTKDPGKVLKTMAEVEAKVSADELTAVGFVTYEAARGFDSSMSVHDAAALPLVCFGLFARSEVVAAPAAAGEDDQQLWRFTEQAQSYCDAIGQIQDLIEAGSVYQINHTTRLQGAVADPAAMFTQVANGAPYAVYIEGDTHTIVSASPECFFSLNGERIYSQPMKGTASRKSDTRTDQAQRDWLAASIKNRSENLMITDMVRNDLGRVALPGTVKVNELFATEQYPTVWQMTSQVEAQTRASVTDIFAHLFPAASITGAPKHAAMAHIKTLETTPREMYTGAIGYIGPNRRAQFNVAIRTATIDSNTLSAQYGAGGGIVWDSDPIEEHQELISKTQILNNVLSCEDFALFETMAWSAEVGAKHLDRHLQRMARSARHFAIPFDRAMAFEAIALAVNGYAKTEVRGRLRLTLDGLGIFSAQLEAVPAKSLEPQPVALAPRPVNSRDPRLHHKTNQREVYVCARETIETRYAKGVEPLLVNERGEITETDIANVVFKQKGNLYTPPQTCGLLPGIRRNLLLQRGELQERVLRAEDLLAVDALYLINDLRGWRDAKLLS